MGIFKAIVTAKEEDARLSYEQDRQQHNNDYNDWLDSQSDIDIEDEFSKTEWIEPV